MSLKVRGRKTRSKSLTPSIKHNVRSCKYRHPNVKIDTSKAIQFNCEDCRRKLRKHALLFGCKRCKFYLCSICNKKPACVNGHILCALHVSKGVECGSCHYQSKKRLQMYHCQACKYYMCLGCYSRETCNGNHGLKYLKIQSKTHKNNRYCHKCQRIYKLNHCLFMCKNCKFSLCGECYQPTLLMKQKIFRQMKISQRISTNSSNTSARALQNVNAVSSVTAGGRRRAQHNSRSTNNSNSNSNNNSNNNSNSMQNAFHNNNSHSNINISNHNNNNNSISINTGAGSGNRNNKNSFNGNTAANVDLTDVHSIVQELQRQYENTIQQSQTQTANDDIPDMSDGVVVDNEEEEKSEVILTDDIVQTHNALNGNGDGDGDGTSGVNSRSRMPSMHSTTSGSTYTSYASRSNTNNNLGDAGGYGYGPYGNMLDGGYSEMGTPSELTRIPSLFTDCCICMENDKSVAFMPCGHYICCESCATAIKSESGECAICSAKILSIMRIFE